MSNPSTGNRRATANIEPGAGLILTLLAPSTQDLQARSQHLSPQNSERSQPSQSSQLDLLALLEKSFEPALRIEAVPSDIAVGISEKFWLIHQNSQLRVPGQFSGHEAEYILQVTSGWDWTVDLKTREPACRSQLLNLLNHVCTPQKPLEVAA